MSIVLGIDVGGSGIKGGLVNVETGELVGKRFKILTPSESTIESIVGVIQEIVKHFEWSGIIGCTFPGVIIDQKIRTSANLNKSCIGKNLSAAIREATGDKAWVLNDADAAALAELRLGSGKDFRGSGIMITIGTGLGSGLFYNGVLFPNTEFGHVIINGVGAETRASSAAMEREGLSMAEWAERFNKYLNYLQGLFWPERFILGGGISKEFEAFKGLLKVPAEIVPAQFKNNAGIVGAALAAVENLGF